MWLFAININSVAVGNRSTGIWEVRYAKYGCINPMNKRKEQRIHSCAKPLSSAPTAFFQRVWWLRRCSHIPLPAKSNPWLFFFFPSCSLSGENAALTCRGYPCSNASHALCWAPQRWSCFLLSLCPCCSWIDEVSEAKVGLLQSSLVPSTETGLENSISHVLVSLGSCLGQLWLWEWWG